MADRTSRPQAAAQPPPRLSTAGPDPRLGTAGPRASTQGRAGFYESYLYQGRGIFASSAPEPGPRAVTFDHLSVAPDAYGRRFVPQGTTLQTYGAGPHFSPRTGTSYATGVLTRDIDVTDSDVEISYVVEGVLNERFCWDDGTLGTVDDTYVKGALPFIRWVDVDD